MLQVGFDVLILGEEIQLTLGSYWLSPWVALREIWNFIQDICLGQYFGYIVASEDPLLKLLLCLSKENCQLACWEWKGELVSVLTVVLVVTVRFATPWGCGRNKHYMDLMFSFIIFTSQLFVFICSQCLRATAKVKM